MTFPILPSNAAVTGFPLRSLRFNSADSAYLNRTFSAINSLTYTFSIWVKRGALGVRQDLIGGVLIITANNQLIAGLGAGGANILSTSQVFRDPSSWYHIVLAMDTTQATASNRTKLYINGQQVTQFSAANYPAQNSATDLGTFTTGGTIGFGPYGSSGYFSGYMTEVNFIDGQALTPSSFGETNATTGQWQPKRYTGTYGTNGFYLNFSDNSGTTATTLGKDYSGNGNNWTPNNFSVTPGAGNDSMIDVPTNWDDGGNGRGNYCTMNPLSTVNCTFANGNLNTTLTTGSSPGSENAVSNFGMSSGKWYCEIVSTGGNAPFLGIADASLQAAGRTYASSSVWSYFPDGRKFNGGTGTSYGASWTSNDVIGIALDMDAGTVTFYKNGISQGVAFSGLTGRSLVAWVSTGTGSVGEVITFVSNFGQRPFAYTPPSGFKALNTQNIAAGTITTSGTFTGNVNADGPFVWLNGVPTAMTINGNAVTFGTHADKLSNGFKVRTSSTSYNNTGSNTYSITTTGARFKVANAQGNP